jgi:hypothetical protein
MIKRVVCLLGLGLILSGCVYEPGYWNRGYGYHEHWHD